MTQNDPGRAPSRRAIPLATAAMGTRFECLLIPPDRNGPDSLAADASVRAAGEAALAEIEAAHRRWTPHAPDSVVARINRAARAGGGSVRIDPLTLELLALAERVRIASAGIFDITAIARATGAGPDTPPGRPSALELDEQMSTVHIRSAELELGAIAKGFALDEAVECLRSNGVGRGLLHGGSSSIVALGLAPDGRPWPVLLEAESGRHALTIELADAAMSVSRPDGRWRDTGGHLVDPRDGRFVSGAEVAACVAPLGLPRAAALVDAWATVLAVLGTRPPGMPPLIASLIGHQGSWEVHGLWDAGLRDDIPALCPEPRV